MVRIMPGIIENSGATSGERKMLFYGVCVPLRLLLALFVFWKSSSPIVQGILLTASAMSMYMNLLGMNSSNEIWWSQEVHLLTSSSTFLLLIGRRPEFVPYVMVLDVLYGLLTSFARDPWNF